MTAITFFGGVREIGGNKIMIDDNGTRIFLDFGMSFSRAAKYFSEFVMPRKSAGLQDFFEFGLLPDIPGLYRKDYIKHMGRKEEKLGVHAVLLSHAHMDHAAYLHHLREEVQLIASEPSIQILKAFEDTGSGAFADFTKLHQSFQFRPKKNGDGFTRIRGDETIVERRVTPVQFGKKFKINHIEVMPMAVDHSLPGATGYIIHTSDGVIVYTGDLRFHGRYKENSWAFVQKAKEAKPDILLVEGTRVGEKDNFTELDVEHEALKHVMKCRGLVICNYPPRDTDRLITFLNIAKASGRILVLDTKQAHLLDLLRQTGVNVPSYTDENIRVYLPRKGWGLIGRDDYPEEIMHQDFEEWERHHIKKDHAVTYKEISENPTKYIFYCNFFQLKELIDIRPPKGSIYLRSLVEPFSDDLELDEERWDNWLKHFNLPKIQIHCSGHASQPDLKKMIEIMKPKMVIPIHTENPEIFKKIVPKGTRVHILKEIGETVEMPKKIAVRV